MTYPDKYLQVDPDFSADAKAVAEGSISGKIHFFNAEGKIDDASGEAQYERNASGEYLNVQNKLIRLDKIITLHGRPGPSYALYDSYANACLACEDLGQFGG